MFLKKGMEAGMGHSSRNHMDWRQGSRAGRNPGKLGKFFFYAKKHIADEGKLKGE